MQKVLLTLALVLGCVFSWAQGINLYPSAVSGMTSSGTAITTTIPILGTSASFVGPIGLGNTTAAPYVYLRSSAANTLSISNGGTAGSPVPQALTIANFCDGEGCATGYERGVFDWTTTANVLSIGTQKAGTGSNRSVNFVVGSAIQWAMGMTTMYPYIDDADDFGASSKKVMNLYLTRSVQGSKSKTLTDGAAAVGLTSCAIPASDYLGGEAIWTAKSTDATDLRSLQGRIRFAGVNKAATTTCTIGVVGTDLLASSNVNTLVCTWTNVAAANVCVLSVTCTDNTAGTQTMDMNYRLDMPLTQTCTPVP